MRIVFIILLVLAVICIIVISSIYYLIQLSNKLKELEILQFEIDEKEEAEN